MNITHHQLTTEDGQKNAVAKYVLAISMNEAVEIKFVPSAKAVIRNAINKRYPLTQYLYAILTHQNSVQGSLYWECIKLLEKMPANTFTDGKALGMFLDGNTSTVNIETKVCLRASPTTSADTLTMSCFWRSYTQLIATQILKGKISGRILLNAIYYTKIFISYKLILLLGILVHYADDTQLVTDTYEKLINEIKKLKTQNKYNTFLYAIVLIAAAVSKSTKINTARKYLEQAKQICRYQHYFADITDNLYHIDYLLLLSIYGYHNYLSINTLLKLNIYMS